MAGIKFEEYAGVEHLVIAPLIEKFNDAGELVEEYGEVQRLAGVQAISMEVNESSETHYYDNMSAIVVDSEGEDTYTLTVSLVNKATRALIEGLTYDAETGALIGTKKKKQYFALGFIGNKLNGVDEYNWVYKGKFSAGSIVHNTLTDGVEATNMEYTYTSIHSATKYAKGGNAKFLSVDKDGKADLDTFFDAVTTPDTIKANTPYKLTITEADGTTVTVMRGTESLENNSVIYKGDELKISCAGGTLKVNGSDFVSGNTHTVDNNTTVVSTAITTKASLSTNTNK